jgi:hypothetical protein
MYIRERFPFCYNSEKTSIEAFININGYYEISEPYDKYGINASFKHEIDTFHHYLMFFDDGIVVDNFYDCNNERLINNPANILEYLKEVNSVDDAKLSFLKSFNWGSYIISGDTIKMGLLNHPAPPSPTWGAFEVWYKVLDRNTIIEIFSSPIQNSTKSNLKSQKKIKAEEVIYPAKFVKIDFKVSSDCWLKKKEWFWCNIEKHKQ